MKLFSIFYICSLLALLVHALPGAIPVDYEFDLEQWVEESWDNLLDEHYDVFSLGKRDEQTVESVLRAINRSGIIWDALDEAADHPSTILKFLNRSSGLVSSLGKPLLLIAGLVNITKVLQSDSLKSVGAGLKESGLVQSLLDGILLDKSYRPVLVRLVDRALLSNKKLIKHIIDDTFKPANKEKRDDHSGSLEKFVENIAGSVLSSGVIGNFLNETFDALNDTGFLTYTVKRFLASDKYVNLTVDVVKDIAKLSDVHLDLSKVNITKIVGAVLDKPEAITTVLGDLLSGKLNLKGLGKYEGSIKAIIKDVESDGVFSELNNYVFPSSSSKQKATSTRGRNRDIEITGLFSSQSASQTPESLSHTTQGISIETASDSSASQLSSFAFKVLLALQASFIGGVFLI